MLGTAYRALPLTPADTVMLSESSAFTPTSGAKTQARTPPPLLNLGEPAWGSSGAGGGGGQEWMVPSSDPQV